LCNEYPKLPGGANYLLNQYSEENANIKKQNVEAFNKWKDSFKQTLLKRYQKAKPSASEEEVKKKAQGISQNIDAFIEKTKKMIETASKNPKTKKTKNNQIAKNVQEYINKSRHGSSKKAGSESTQKAGSESANKDGSESAHKDVKKSSDPIPKFAPLQKPEPIIFFDSVGQDKSV